MGHLCHVSDAVLPSRVQDVATAIMATMANRKKPDKKFWHNVDVRRDDGKGHPL